MHFHTTMLRALPVCLVILALFLMLPETAYSQGNSVNNLYQKHCSQCHGLDRLGGQGPALLPQNLHRLRKAKAEGVIARGRPATQMPGFESLLNAQQIKSLTEFIYTRIRCTPKSFQDRISK